MKGTKGAMERSYLRPKQRRQLLALLKALVDSDAIMPEDVPPILVQLLPSPLVPVVALFRLQASGDDDFAAKFRFPSSACLRSLHAALQLQDEIAAEQEIIEAAHSMEGATSPPAKKAKGPMQQLLDSCERSRERQAE